MKRYIMTVCLCSLMAMATEAQDKRLVILHTNDTHSCIMPLNENLSDKEIAGRGGYLRRLEFMKEQREEDPDLLYFDSGDFSQGSPFYTLFKGDVEIGLMNRMGLDAATVGNHEFDYGLENMARLFRKANFPIVCANYDFTGTPVEGLVKPYVIIKRKGVKIGVFGLSPQLEGLVGKNTCKGVRYLDPVAKANEVATLLKEKKKCDLVICISHLGWIEGGLGDQAIIAASRNIDLVLGGHSHTYFTQLEHVANLDGKLIPVDQNGKNGVWIGKITIDLKKK
ncbi:MAG: metallophosphatase [Prevotella sp.]|nr:metallophosphatase [Prevotella sp.]